MKNKKRPLPNEPAENNPDSTLIALRSPHDGSLLKRRFLKTEKIQVDKLINNYYITINIYINKYF
jgi:hypothetical protein